MGNSRKRNRVQDIEGGTEGKANREDRGKYTKGEI
jgi:hypothetical protein